MKSVAEAKIKRVRALELVALGKTYDEVAREVGYSHRGSAHRAVFRALGDHEAEGVAHLRALELARLDKLQSSLWESALSGDIPAVSAVLRIIDQRTRLLGLVPQATARTTSAPISMFAEDWGLNATQEEQRPSQRETG